MSVQVHVRVSPERRARWQALAESRGLSLTAFLVESVEGPAIAADERLSSVEEELRDELRDLERRLARIESLAEGRSY